MDITMDISNITNSITNESALFPFVDALYYLNTGIVVYTVYKQTYFLIAFAVGLFWNNYTNSFVKTWIKEPRPKPVYGDHPVQKYGMPSGHTQHVVFCVTFLYLMKTNSYVVFTAVAIALAVMFQRYYVGAHTIKQIVGGAALGAFNAWLAIWAVKEYIQNIV